MPDDNHIFQEVAQEGDIQLDENGEIVESNPNSNSNPDPNPDPNSTQDGQDGQQGGGTFTPAQEQGEDPENLITLDESGNPVSTDDNNGTQGQQGQGDQGDGRGPPEEEIGDFQEGKDTGSEENDDDKGPEELLEDQYGLGEEPEQNENAGKGDDDQEQKEDNSDTSASGRSPSEEGSSSSETDPDTIRGFVSALREEGVITSDKIKDEDGNEREIKSAEDLVKLKEQELEDRVKEKISEYDEDVQDVIKAKQQGVTLDQLEEYKRSKTNEIFYQNIDPEKVKDNVEAQRSLVENDFIRRGYSKEKAQKFREDLENNERLQEESLDALNGLREAEEQEQEKLKKEAKEKEEKEKQQRREQLENFKEKVNKSDELLPGVPITKNERKKILEAAERPVEHDENGNPVNLVQKYQRRDPIEFQRKLLGLIVKGYFDDNADTSRHQKAAKSKAAQELNKKFKQKGDPKPGRASSKGPSSGSDNNSGEDDPSKIASAIPDL